MGLPSLSYALSLFNTGLCNDVQNSIGRTLVCIWLSSDSELTRYYSFFESLVSKIDNYHLSLELYIKCTDFPLRDHCEPSQKFNFNNCSLNEIHFFLS